MTFKNKTLQAFIGASTIIASLAIGSVSALAASSAPEKAFPDNTIKYTMCSYKFNFTNYFNNTVNLLNTNPYDKFDAAGGTQFCYVQDNYNCTVGATLGGAPVVGLFANTVNGVTYPAQGDITVGSGTNYCLNAAIPEIFKAIAPSNNVNKIPEIYDKTGKTGAAGETYYAPGKWDNGICQRNADGSVVMKPNILEAYNQPNEAGRAAFRAKLGNRNCNVTPYLRQIYQFKYIVEYPSNEVCNTFYANLKPKVVQYYDAEANGTQIRNLYKLVSGKSDSQFTPTDLTGFYNYFKAYNTAAGAFGTTAGQIDCPAYYKSALGSKFGLTSNKGIIATDTYHWTINESYTAQVGWRKVETGRRLSETDPLKKAWDGYAAFNL